MEKNRVFLYLPDLLFRSLVICVRLALPWSVFAILAETGEITHEFARSMIWAVLIGQVMTSSSLKLHDIVKKEVRTGEISTRISEPANYYLAKIFGSAGYFVPRFTILSILFFLPFSVFVGGNIDILSMVIFIPLGTAIFLTINMIIGLLSFIIEENNGIFWIFNKLFLVFGNQVIPVALLPASVIEYARWTPFYLSLAGPFEVASGREDFLWAFTVSTLYILAFVMLGIFMLKKIRKELISNG